MPGLAESIALRLRSWLGADGAPVVATAAASSQQSSAAHALTTVDAAAGAVRIAASSGGVARAIGRAATGERVTLALQADEIAEAARPLCQAARCHVGLVAVWRDNGGDCEAVSRDVAAELAANGLAVVRADAVQQAYDAAALARWLAEATLAPVLVVLRGDAASDVAQPWQAVEPAALANWLGRPTEEIDAATPPQAWVFGRQRARLVARWDSGHAVAVGQTMPSVDRRAAVESGQLWFAQAWPTLAATAVGSWRVLTGRESAALVSAAPPTANRKARPMAGHSAYPQRELLIQAVRRDYPDAVARNGAAAVHLTAPADPWLQRALRQRAEREGSPADCASLARLWGEFVLPRAAGEANGELDPWLAAATTPAASAELFDRSDGRANLPVFNPAACTACGACWSACPDAALAPVALATQAWLDAAADRAMTAASRGPAADRSKRLHKAVAQRLDDELARTAASAPTAAMLDAAWHAAADKANLQGDERVAAETAWNHTVSEALVLQPAASRGLFHDAHKQRRGAGLLLQLALDPRACQDCGLCVAACRDGALTAQPQNDATLEAARAGWLAWERTTDTAGAAIDQARQAGLDHLAALLLSRHANRALCGADLALPGSGQRLAVRLYAAVAEQRRGTALLQRIHALETLAGKLDEATRSVFAAAAPTGDPQALLAVLDSTASRTAPLRTIAEQLAERGLGTALDIGRLRRLAEAAALLAAARHRLTKASGWGQARYGVVVAGPTIAAWAGQFPRNPFTGPAWVDDSAGALDAAIGLAEGELMQAVADARAVRAAELALANPADADLQLERLAHLRREDLTAAERATALPVLVLVDRQALQGAGLSGLVRALGCGLALHVLYLRDGLAAEPVDVVRLARATGDIAVARTSVAHGDHLFASAAAALDGHLPSLTSILALDSSATAFASCELLARSAEAVDDGRHPLLRLGPGQPAESGAADAMEAAREQAAVAHRAELARAIAELRDAHAADLEAARAAWQAQALQRLREQLVRLARSAPPRAVEPGRGAAA